MFVPNLFLWHDASRLDEREWMTTNYDLRFEAIPNEWVEPLIGIVAQVVVPYLGQRYNTCQMVVIRRYPAPLEINHQMFPVGSGVKLTITTHRGTQVIFAAAVEQHRWATMPVVPKQPYKKRAKH